MAKIEDFDKIEIINPSQYIFSRDSLLYFKGINKANPDVISEIKILEKTFTNFYYKDQILSIFTSTDISNYKIVTP
ncbi:hypothetical protein [Flavobacterium sp. SORGH_AS_0622]|uniref:hypothetical protein n=1 Tax=Flavobacterium sp. SORGH_AS_0622 TaxID=3041772 RepID=UPI0027D825D4|nr:hypothetical protein [Flavobacterium sp. SORGH_AS_0622]